MTKISLMVGASLLAAVASQGLAQTAAVPAAEQDPGGLADIIVTATKVETTLQKTPQAITSLDNEALLRAGVSTAQDLSKLVTGLNIESNGSNAAIFIRGIGSRTLSPTSDPAIAFGVDGVYYARASGLAPTIYDIARVEVVKGPQGTLYGRNATGGAVNIITNRPLLGQQSAQGELEVGNYGALRANAAVNIPLGNTVALRLAGQSNYNSGYLSDGYNDTNIKAGRASLVWEPVEQVSVFASFDYASQGGKGPGYVPLGPSVGNTSLATRFVVPGNPFVGPSDPRINAVIQAAAPAQAVPGPGAGTYCRAQVTGAPTAGGIPARLLCTYPFGVAPITNDGFLNNEFYGANLTIETDLGFAKLTTVGGYRHTKVDTLQRADIGRQRLSSTADQYSAEVRLSSDANSTGPLKWVLGGYYLRENQVSRGTIASNDQAIPVPTVVCATAPVNGICVAQAPLIQRQTELFDPDISNETYAGFGQATLSLAHWLRVTGGVRFTHEQKNARNGTITLVYSTPANFNRTYPSQGTASFDDTSYRLGLEVDVAPRSMLYAHLSTGFHAGGFNLGVEPGPNRYKYDPEKVKSYVVGIKNRFFDNRVQLNIEGFWLDFDNYQFNSLGYINDGSPACTGAGVRTACPLNIRTDNARKVRLRGVEADVAWRVFDHGTLDFNILYNDAKYIDFDVVSPFNGAVTSYAGVQLPSTNKLTIGVGYTHEFLLGNEGRIVASARTQYRDGMFVWYTRTPSQYQEAYTRTDLSLGYEAPAGRWNVKAFVRNLEGKATTFQGAGTNAATGLFFTVLNPPRTYGASVGFKF